MQIMLWSWPKRIQKSKNRSPGLNISQERSKVRLRTMIKDENDPVSHKSPAGAHDQGLTCGSNRLKIADGKCKTIFIQIRL